jgi:hypothetical protein
VKRLRLTGTCLFLQGWGYIEVDPRRLYRGSGPIVLKAWIVLKARSVLMGAFSLFMTGVAVNPTNAKSRQTLNPVKC